MGHQLTSNKESLLFWSNGLTQILTPLKKRRDVLKNVLTLKTHAQMVLNVSQSLTLSPDKEFKISVLIQRSQNTAHYQLVADVEKTSMVPVVPPVCFAHNGDGADLTNNGNPLLFHNSQMTSAESKSSTRV